MSFKVAAQAVSHRSAQTGSLEITNRLPHKCPVQGKRLDGVAQGRRLDGVAQGKRSQSPWHESGAPVSHSPPRLTPRLHLALLQTPTTRLRPRCRPLKSAHAKPEGHKPPRLTTAPLPVSAPLNNAAPCSSYCARVWA
eukprot:355293-Chlamydomonas_euryale.AAC.6